MNGAVSKPAMAGRPRPWVGDSVASYFGLLMAKRHGLNKPTSAARPSASFCDSAGVNVPSQ
jgi:hypothetical protein